MTLFRQLMLWGLLICALPMVSVFAATAIGGFFGCNVNEAGTNPCVVGGVDLGITLATMFTMGWFGLMTLPVAALLVVVWILAEIFNLFRRKA